MGGGWKRARATHARPRARPFLGGSDEPKGAAGTLQPALYHTLSIHSSYQDYASHVLSSRDLAAPSTLLASFSPFISLSLSCIPAWFYVYILFYPLAFTALLVACLSVPGVLPVVPELTSSPSSFFFLLHDIVTLEVNGPPRRP